MSQVSQDGLEHTQVAVNDLELLLLPPPPVCWDYTCVQMPGLCCAQDQSLWHASGGPSKLGPQPSLEVSLNPYLSFGQDSKGTHSWAGGCFSQQLGRTGSGL